MDWFQWTMRNVKIYYNTGFGLVLAKRDKKKKREMSKSKGICWYNPKWDTDEQYKDWLKPFKLDSHKALCIVWCIVRDKLY